MTFRQFLDDVLLPMFPGVEIGDDELHPERRIKSLVSFAPGANAIRVRENIGDAFLELARAQSFESFEKDLIENLVRAFIDVKSEAEGFLVELEDEIIRKAIAKTVAPDRESQQRVIAKILTTLSNWAAQTYEGERVSSGFVVTTSHFADPRLETSSLFQEDFAKGLTDGVDSWWRVAAIGGIRRVESSDDETELTTLKDGFFPERYRPIVLRTGGNAVSITLNRNGEILVFSNQTLRFAMRRGGWVNFAHNSIVKQMSSGGAGSVTLRRAIHASCLDVSFARTGGCIGLLRTRDLAQFRKDKIVPKNSRIDAVDNTKAQAAAALVAGRRFDSLPRNVRKELLGLDGALVLHPNGSVYAAGAILNLGNVHLGTEGGRSAAAKTLSKYGLGIKISEDGMISGYKKETGNEVPSFKIG
jgi:DNA integrity scanning protein DisA with diadenylate cyclase activity